MKKILPFIFAGVLLIGVVFLLMQGGSVEDEVVGANTNVSIVEGQQMVEIKAKGGYKPRISVAQADMPTTIKVKTQGTFDCSSALVIPSIGYQTNLPPSGETEIQLPAQKAGTVLEGLCAMGMYSFQIQFSS